MRFFSIKKNESVEIKFLMFQLRIPDLKYRYNKLKQKTDMLIFNTFQLMQAQKVFGENKPFPECIAEKLKLIKKPPEYLYVDSKHNWLNILLGFDKIEYKEKLNYDDAFLFWEAKDWADILNYAMYLNKDVIFAGDSFLRSVDTKANKNAKPKYVKGISFTFDDLTPYFDATRPSRLELLLNDKNLVITDEQKRRARNCIDKILETHLTKYNHQPVYKPEIGRRGVKKVLVVDQSYGDMSILRGWGSDETFEKMLDCAIKENSDADIIVKTHPDAIGSNVGTGYYTGLNPHGNIYTQTEPINPISLIKYADKVYVCSTQLGFEALMCGKEVRVFGMPFYAGWGLTKDEQKCDRRTNSRTLEEIFYIAYIMYSRYVNPERKCECEIEEAMDYLLKLRSEYFKENERER